jgi:hypothetical protein
MVTRTVGKPSVTVETLEAAGVVKVALAPPVADRTLQLTVLSEPPVMFTLICRFEPGRTWTPYVGPLGITATCAASIAGRDSINNTKKLMAFVRAKNFTPVGYLLLIDMVLL